MNWQLLSSRIPTTPEEILEIIAENRGIADLPDFLSPKHPLAFSLAEVGIDSDQVTKALELLRAAKESHRPVIVFGDYDADGISSTTILWQTLHGLGFDAKPFIPHREKHGYGISAAAIADLQQQGWLDEVAGQRPLLITVDTGIVAHERIAELKQLGLHVIVTDHHVAEKEKLPADAVVHTTQLCGATVSWMFSREITAAFSEPVKDKTWQLDLAGLATIADQVPLRDANRAFAWWGIRAMRTTTRPGIVTLLRQAGVAPESVDETTINYVIGPRINAMGRLAHGLEALRLLCTTNQNRAQLIAEGINTINTQRQQLTDDLVRIALSQQSDWQSQKLIVVASPAYHEGVIGLVAGKLAEQFNKPAIVIAVGETKAKASARSIPGINIIEFLRQHRELFTELGGHPMAAGFGAKVENVTHLSKTLVEAALSLSFDTTHKEYQAESELPFTLVNVETYQAIKHLQPFGQGNPEPLFFFKELEVGNVKSVGKSGQHIKFSASQNDKILPVVAWNRKSWLTSLDGQPVSLLATIQENNWKGKTTLQLCAKTLGTTD